MPRDFSYDPACEELANHFLGAASDRLKRELAQEIQRAVEDWMEAEADRLRTEIVRKPQ